MKDRAAAFARRTLPLDSRTTLFGIAVPPALPIALILALAVIPPAMGRLGWDYMNAYRGDVLIGRYEYYVFNPRPAHWLCYPFAVLPGPLGNLLWNLAAAFSFLYALKRFGGSSFWFAVSLPCFWILTQGQIDWMIVLGLALAFASSPWTAGAGLLLLSMKPQVGLLPIAWVLWTRRDWRLLVVPGLVYAASFVRWGFWVDEWVRSFVVRREIDLGQVESMSLYPYALALAPLLLLVRDLKIWLLLQSIAMPVSGVYSFAPALTLGRFRSVPFVVIGTWAACLLSLRGLLPVRSTGVVMLAAFVWELAAFRETSKAKQPSYPVLTER